MSIRHAGPALLCLLAGLGMKIQRKALRQNFIPKQPKGPVARRHPCRREPSPSAAIAMSAGENVSISVSGRCGRNGGVFLFTHVIEEQSEPAGGAIVAVGVRWGRLPGGTYVPEGTVPVGCHCHVHQRKSQHIGIRALRKERVHSFAFLS